MVVKNKQKRKMMRTRFGQSPRRHSRKGMKSCILAVLSFLLLVFMIWISFCLKGNVNILVGFCRTVYYGDGRIWHLSGRYRTERKR